MIEGLKLDYDEDGIYLVIDNDEAFIQAIEYHTTRLTPRLRLRVDDDNLAQLDASMQGWRDHMADGEAVRQERLAVGRALLKADEEEFGPPETLLEAADLARKHAKGE